MMCCRDQTFCSAADCRDPDCDRKITDGVERAAARCGLMVSVAELHKTCAVHVAYKLPYPDSAWVLHLATTDDGLDINLHWGAKDAPTHAARLDRHDAVGVLRNLLAHLEQAP